MLTEDQEKTYQRESDKWLLFALHRVNNLRRRKNAATFIWIEIGTDDWHSLKNDCFAHCCKTWKPDQYSFEQHFSQYFYYYVLENMNDLAGIDFTNVEFEDDKLSVQEHLITEDASLYKLLIDREANKVEKKELAFGKIVNPMTATFSGVTREMLYLFAENRSLDFTKHLMRDVKGWKSWRHRFDKKILPLIEKIFK